MEALKIGLTYFLGFLFMLASTHHIFKPKLSDGMIPDIFNKRFVHIFTAIIEFGLGILCFFEQTQYYALLGIFILMILFLPIHVYDATKERPVIGSKKIAYIRILIQFLFIYLPWFAAHS